MQSRRSSIEVLPLPVVEKIAAGEVIERPASVLKELIENAIDAGATKIEAAVDGAGFSKISVVDNGNGMPEADLAKCLLLHATSKIRTADDLFAVTTMGFRGEALASIAAVSRLSVATSADASGLGFEIVAEGGAHGTPRPMTHAQGAVIEVRDLFFNVPARKKFMKSLRSEQMALTKLVEQLAAAFPAIHFSLVLDGNRALDLPPAATRLMRIGQIAGTTFVKELIECKTERPGLEVVAYVSSPEFAQSRPRFQNLYVNSRRVDNESVMHAVREAFSRFLTTRYRPSYFCYLTLDPSRMDINVHPTKQLVKFDDERALFGIVFGCVHQGIGDTLTVRHDMVGNKPAGGTDAGRREGIGAEEDARQESMRLAAKEPATTRFSLYPRDGRTAAEYLDSEEPAAFERRERAPVDEQGPLPGESAVRERTETVLPFPTPTKFGERMSGMDSGGKTDAVKGPVEGETAWNLISCYQIHETYILAPIKNGILLIDQHAAHERVLFEQALEDIESGRSASQQLLFPVVIELSAMEKSVVMAGLSYFSAFGFETSDFGGSAVAISAMPFFMRTADVEETVRSMVRYLLDENDRDAVNAPQKRFAAAFACGAAIKAGQKLTQEEMNALVNSLFAAKSPYTCPHGRPTLVRISLDELGRRFLRQ